MISKRTRMASHIYKYLCWAALGGLLVTACTPVSLLMPVLEPEETARVARLVHARTTGVHTLAAVLAMQFAGAARQGTVDLIVNYDASGPLRFLAFKHLVMTTRPVFDLLFTGETYRLEVSEADGTRLYQGATAVFARRHPHLRAFWIIGEGFFLPGFDTRKQPPVPVEVAASVLTTRLRNGVTARWFVDPATLEITRAQIASFEVEYGDYRAVGAYTVPGRVILSDQRTGFTTRAVLKQVEINLPLPPGAFDVSLRPGWHVSGQAVFRQGWGASEPGIPAA